MDNPIAGVLIWLPQVVETMKTKFFIKTTAEKTPPKESQTFVDAVTKLLEEHGVADDTKRKQCAFYLFQITIKFYRGLTKDPLVTNEKLQRLTDDMKSELEKYGVKTNEEQEAIIVDYFVVLKQLGLEAIK